DSAAQRRRAALVLRLVIDFLDNALRLRVRWEAEPSEPSIQRLMDRIADVGQPDAGDRALLGELAERLNSERLLDVLERWLEGDAQIDRRVQLVLTLEALLDATGQQLWC